MTFYKGVARNKPSNIRVLLADTGIAPWSLPHICFSEKEGIMEIISYVENREKVRDALGKLGNVKRIEGEKFLGSLSPPARANLYKRMETVKSHIRCSGPVRRFLRIFKRKWIEKSDKQSKSESHLEIAQKDKRTNEPDQGIYHKRGETIQGI